MHPDAVIGPALKAPSIVRSVVGMRRTHRETRDLMRRAIATALCRTAPESSGVRKLAETIEDRLWDVPREDVDRWPRIAKAGRRIRKSARRLEWRDVDFLHWREDLGKWVGA